MAFFTDIHWPLVGMMIFFGLFVMILFFQQKRYSNEDLRTIENLPFEGDEE